jgi:hypothetical protein
LKIDELGFSGVDSNNPFKEITKEEIVELFK